MPGSSKPMPDGVGEQSADDGATPTEPTEATETTDATEATEPVRSQAPAFSPPPVLADVNFDDLLPPEPEFESESQSLAFSVPRGVSETAFDDGPSPSQPGFPAPEQPQPPAFPTPPSMSETSFDVPTPMPAPPPGFPAPPVANASGLGGMGISLSGPGVPHTAPSMTPAQVAATSQSLRIRLLRPDGKPFDGPEITTGPKGADDAGGTSGAGRTGLDGVQRGPKKQAPKVVVKTGPLERIGHAAAVLAISAIGIVPLAYLLLQSVHDREDKLAATITVPTKMNVLDGTSGAYLGGMVVVLLVVAVLYWSRLKRRRTR
ncbi:hypothetical protein GCM10009838_04470 [Catenulispora subtropica]|uniref:Uncharacterized protein n=1 Tax=Catenulispora subtropica TaxID=450798 RepID=A0ABP5BTT4_9ACTN